MSAFRYAAIRAAFELLWASHLPGLVRRFSRSKGVIFTLHRVLPEEPAAFSPNAILQVTPDFLRYAIKRVRKLGLDIVSEKGEGPRIYRIRDPEPAAPAPRRTKRKAASPNAPASEGAAPAPAHLDD